MRRWTGLPLAVVLSSVAIERLLDGIILIFGFFLVGQYVELPGVLVQGSRVLMVVIALLAGLMTLAILNRARADEVISVGVDILENIAVDFAISIEILRVGIGWEIVVLLDHQPVAETNGSYRVDIPLRELPLAPGEYSLNVFLSRRDNGQSLDVRSWTYGNSYDLTLEGEPRTTVARLPFVTRKPSAGNV